MIQLTVKVVVALNSGELLLGVAEFLGSPAILLGKVSGCKDSVYRTQQLYSCRGIEKQIQLCRFSCTVVQIQYCCTNYAVQILLYISFPVVLLYTFSCTDSIVQMR